MNKCVLVTGAAGGIGQALVRALADAGYAVIGTDLVDRPADLPCEHFIACDLQKTVADENYAADAFARIRQALAGRPLAALVNNAAVQVLGPVDMLSRQHWRTTLDVNLLAPFLWAQALLPELEAAHGMVLNISSIHARLTKSGFVAYATSKAALSGMTRAMAVELGSRVRVNAIEPAAIDTPMLRAGFIDNEENFQNLSKYNPSQGLGSPSQLAQIAVFLTESKSPFLNGTVVCFDGGISASLLEPSSLS